MFDLVCISLAVILAAASLKGYRLIAVIIALEFVAHKLAYNHLMLDMRADNGWLIFLMYSVIQISAMSILLFLKSHFVITALLFMNLVYNLLTAASYFYNFDVNFYQAYEYFIGTIMIFELIYLGLLNKYVHTRKYRDDSHNYIDSVFCIRPGHSGGGLA